MKKLLISCLLIYSLVLTACPSKVTLEKARRESAKIAGYADQTTNAVRDLFRAGVLTPAQTARIADKIIVLAKAGQAFDAVIATLETTYGTTDNVPKAEWARALALFNSDLVQKFIDVLVELKVIEVSGRMRNSIDLVINAVRLIARAFEVEADVNRRIAAAQEV
ncbi:MAG: hypothetical protein JSS81_05910 [Acidobacteria bacterium]|nr:hypothetical protein [Acidobacteriota bacterium]